MAEAHQPQGLALVGLSAGPMTMFHEPLLRTAIAHLRPALANDAILLDLGCGYGSVAAAMRSEGMTLAGLDRDPEAVRYAQRRCPHVRYLVADAHDIPFATGCIDALLSVSVLQYVDWRRVIVECHRVLKIGGRAVFIENLRGNPFVAIYRVLRRVAWLLPALPGLRRIASDAVPLEHIDWHERHQFAEVFGSAENTAHYLTTPLALVQTSLFDRLAHLDHGLLATRPGLARRAWLMTVKVTKTRVDGTDPLVETPVLPTIPCSPNGTNTDEMLWKR